MPETCAREISSPRRRGGPFRGATAILFCSVLLAWQGPPAAARDRLDLVILANGDRVHGEIISLYSATLVVRTVGLGTVEIDWPDIGALHSPQLFEVELANGRRVVGRFASYAPEGSLVLGSDAEELEPSATPATAAPSPPVTPETPAGGGPPEKAAPLPPSDRTFSLSEVVAIRQRGTTLWQSHRGYLDFGFNLAGANDDTELSAQAEFTLRGQRMRWSSDVALSVRDDADSEQRQRWQAQSLVEFPAGRRWVWTVAGQHQRNDDLDLEARESIIGAAYWVAIRSARGRLLLGAGASESRERYAGEAESESVAAAVVAFGGDYDRFGAHSTNASFGVLYLPAFNQDGRYRIDAQAKLRQKIARDFTVTLSPYYNYDSHPPRASILKEDWGLTSSIGWLF